MSISASVIGTMLLANASSGITPSIVMSRPDDGVTNPAMWVAPCAVIFDATVTTKTDESDPFRNLHYAWDYGDEATANEYWDYGARPGTQSKNRDIGPVVGHVYEEPGTYYATLTVVDAAGNINAVRQQIVITDPDVVFAGANTICVSSSGDFTGAPTDPDTQKITSSDYSSVWNTYVDAGKRVLFNRNEVFTAASVVNQKIDVSNVQIGVFGSGTAKAEIQITSASAVGVIRLWNRYTELNNWQAYDLKITNPSQFTGQFGLSATISGALNTVRNIENGLITALRVETSDVFPFQAAGYGIAIVECSAYRPVGTTGIVGIWGQSVTLPMIYGNYVDNDNLGEHCIRLQGHYKCAIAHNHTARAAATKSLITLRGHGITSMPSAWTANTSAISMGDFRIPTIANGFIYRVARFTSSTDRTTGADEPVWPTTLGEVVQDGGVLWMCEYTDTLPVGFVSGFGNVYDNYIDGTDCLSPIMCAIIPQGTSNYEVMTDYIWHHNYHSKSTHANTESINYLQLQGSRVFVRNNIFDCSSPDTVASIAAIQALGSNTAGIPVPSNIIVENNSIYSSFLNPDSNKPLRAIYFSAATATGMEAKNNIVYAPNNTATATDVVVDNTGSAVLSNNSTKIQMKNTNPFVNASPVVANDFKLTSGSYALGAGAGVDGLFVDYFDTTRSRLTAPDMGAIDARS